MLELQFFFFKALYKINIKIDYKKKLKNKSTWLKMLKP